MASFRFGTWRCPCLKGLLCKWWCRCARIPETTIVVNLWSLCLAQDGKENFNSGYFANGHISLRPLLLSKNANLSTFQEGSSVSHNRCHYLRCPYHRYHYYCLCFLQLQLQHSLDCRSLCRHRLVCWYVHLLLLHHITPRRHRNPRKRYEQNAQSGAKWDNPMTNTNTSKHANKYMQFQRLYFNVRKRPQLPDC